MTAPAWGGAAGGTDTCPAIAGMCAACMPAALGPTPNMDAAMSDTLRPWVVAAPSAARQRLSQAGCTSTPSDHVSSWESCRKDSITSNSFADQATLQGLTPEALKQTSEQTSAQGMSGRGGLHM